MPIVTHKPAAEPKLQPSLPKIESTPVQSIVVDTKYQPLNSLLVYVEGSIWRLTYYSQIVDISSDLRGQDIGQSAVYQQYNKILELDIKVSSPLTQSQDKTTKMFTVNGNGFIPSFLVPNEGDMFVADVGDGREGVFEITLSEKKSLLKESVYYIEYHLVYFSDEEKVKRQDLDNKVIKSLYYNKDFLLHGQNPLITTTEFNSTIDLKSTYYEIIQNYFGWFFSKQFSTITIPEQTLITYDHFVTDTLLSILETTDEEHVRYVRRMNIEDDYHLQQPQLFKALLKKDNSLIRLANTQMGLMSTKYFSNNPMMESIRFSGINYVLYPKNPTDNTDHLVNRLDYKLMSDTTLIEFGTPKGNLNDIITITSIDNDPRSVPFIKRVLIDDYYVLSSAFYNNVKTEQSLLELMVNQYLNNEKINIDYLMKLASGYNEWGGLERFYYIPILLILIKYTIRSI